MSQYIMYQKIYYFFTYSDLFYLLTVGVEVIVRLDHTR